MNLPRIFIIALAGLIAGYVLGRSSFWCRECPRWDVRLQAARCVATRVFRIDVGDYDAAVDKEVARRHAQ